MKKIILFLMGLFLIGMVSAEVYRPTANNQILSTIEQPVPPSGTGNVGECTPPETKDYTCLGDISSYQQCVKTATQGGVWQLQQIDCKSYGQEVSCQQGQCVRQGSGLPIKQQYQTLIIIGLGLFVIYLATRRRK